MQYGEPGPRPADCHLSGADGACLRIRSLALAPQGTSSTCGAGSSVEAAAAEAEAATAARTAAAAEHSAPGSVSSVLEGGGAADSAEGAAAADGGQDPGSGAAAAALAAALSGESSLSWRQLLLQVPSLLWASVATDRPSSTRLQLSGVSLSLLTFPSTWQGYHSAAQAALAAAQAPLGSAFFSFTAASRPPAASAADDRFSPLKRRRGRAAVPAPGPAADSQHRQPPLGPLPASQDVRQQQQHQQPPDYWTMLQAAAVPVEEHCLFQQWEAAVTLCLLPPGYAAPPSAGSGSSGAAAASAGGSGIGTPLSGASASGYSSPNPFASRQRSRAAAAAATAAAAAAALAASTPAAAFPPSAAAAGTAPPPPFSMSALPASPYDQPRHSAAASAPAAAALGASGSGNGRLDSLDFESLPTLGAQPSVHYDSDYDEYDDAMVGQECPVPGAMQAGAAGQQQQQQQQQQQLEEGVHRLGDAPHTLSSMPSSMLGTGSMRPEAHTVVTAEDRLAADHEAIGPGEPPQTPGGVPSSLAEGEQLAGQRSGSNGMPAAPAAAAPPPDNAAAASGPSAPARQAMLLDVSLSLKALVPELNAGSVAILAR